MSKPNYYAAELVERIDITERLAIFKFLPEKRENFIPGQFVTIGLPDGEKMTKRAYSLVSAPTEPLMEFFIELVSEGKLTPRLFELKVGDKAFMRSPIAGKFILDRENSLKRHLMIATVTGIAPFLSMLRAAHRQPDEHRFLVLHGASHSQDFGPYLDELNRLAQSERLTYVATVSRAQTDPDWRGERGRVEDITRKYADQHDFTADNSIAYACGHPLMIDKVKAILDRARFPKTQIKEERYFIAPKN